jgi:CDP-glycerol glycerophosphotransferase
LRARAIRLLVVIRSAFSKTRIQGLLYVAITKHFPIARDRVLLESHHGREFFGNPYYIAASLVSSPNLDHLKLVIVCSSRNARRLRDAFPIERFKRCKKGSIRYIYHLARCEYLINDSTFPAYFSRRQEQKYLNTWHGTPLKTLGRRMKEAMPRSISNTQRNLLHTTHILSPNDPTRAALLDDYMIRDLWHGKLIDAGYPRNDILHIKRPDPKRDRYAIAFMPTWRGTLETLGSAGARQVQQLQSDLQSLDQRLPENVIVWVRLHPLVSGSVEFGNFKRVRPFPSDVEPYDHLATCSLLITDYSSVMFDFAETARSVVLYSPDLAAYEEERAFYFGYADLPFLRTDRIDELVQLIPRAFHPVDESPEWDAFLQRYAPYRGSNNSDRVCESFFVGASAHETVNQPARDRKRVLIFPGSMQRNGITSAVKSLLPRLDLSRCQVWLALGAGSAQENAGDYFDSLDSDIGFFPTQSYLAAGPLELLVLLLREFIPSRWPFADGLNRRVWQREWRRLFGPAQFDSVVHFSGYGRRLANLTSASSGRRVVFAHNSMGREIRAKGVSRRALTQAYRRADVVAVVRESLIDEISRDVWDIRDKALVVPNAMDLRCQELATHPLEESIGADNDPNVGLRLAAMLEKPRTIRLMNLARFSAEKGQIRLIEAFEKVWLEGLNAQLFIVGGYGPLYSKVRRRAARSPAAENLLVMQGSNNPFPLLSRMDTLILASTYEGQPLTIYEAFALGKSVVSTDIPGPSELLRRGYGLLIDDTASGLQSGIRAAIAGDLPGMPYDFNVHNQQAVVAFNSAVLSADRTVGLAGPVN